MRKNEAGKDGKKMQGDVCLIPAVGRYMSSATGASSGGLCRNRCEKLSQKGKEERDFI